MATLFQTASQLRRIVVFVLIGVIVILVVDNVSRYLSSPNNIFSQKPTLYRATDSNYGTIPAPPMTSATIGDKSIKAYAFTGSFAAFPDTALVYTIQKPLEGLTTVQDAVNIAATMGFTDTYTAISGDEISWQNTANTKTLTFNKVTKQWRLRTKYLFDTNAQSVKNLRGDISYYQQNAPQLASRLGFNDRSIVNGDVHVAYALLGADGLFTNPVDTTSANYVSMDIFRQLEESIPKTLQELPSGYQKKDLPPDVTGDVYHIDPVYGSLFGDMHMIVSNQASNPVNDLYELDFTDYTYNYTGFTVRNIITAAEAWDKVSAQGGALTQLRLETADYFSQNQSLNVTKFTADAAQTKLGYFEPDPWDGFVYPVYIFQGKADTDKGVANFTFFVDALRRF